MQLSLQNFSTLVNNMAASAQGACSTLLDMSVGSVLRALLESSASVGLWLQYLILQVLSMTRLSTSSGADVDSWIADFGLTRLPAVAATGVVSLNSLNPASQSATVLSGALVKTTDGLQSFVVVGGPYIRAQGVASILVPVTASIGGPAGNIQAGLVNTLGTAIPGIDTVINTSAFTGGLAAETDQAVKSRFVAYLNTRSQATRLAVSNAISSVQQGLSYIIQENVTSVGGTLPGFFNVFLDDGSGTPSASLLENVYNSIDLVRPIGSSFSVNPPNLLIATITITVSTPDVVTFTRSKSIVSDAITEFINVLPIGQSLRFSRLAGLAYEASSDITNVISVTLNGSYSDLGGQPASVVRSGVVTILSG